MDRGRQNSWFSITAYVLSSFAFLGILLFIAETYFPNQSSNLMPLQRDRISRWIFNSPPWRAMQKTDAAGKAQPQKLFLKLNQKHSAGRSELIYRGLVGRSEFQVDVIILELDPQVSYPHRFKIAEAKKSLRLANLSYRLIAAKKGALHLKRITSP